MVFFFMRDPMSGLNPMTDVQEEAVADVWASASTPAESTTRADEFDHLEPAVLSRRGSSMREGGFEEEVKVKEQV